MVMPLDEFTQPQLNPEDVAKYKTYRESGGLLGYQEWFNSVNPAAKYKFLLDQSAAAWLERFRVWADYMISSGQKDQSEIDILSQDLYDQLTGEGNYVGKRRTVWDLPSTIVNDVEKYWTSLPVEAQKQIDLAAKQAAQRAQDIASQRNQLPLGAGGTQEQQVNAGYRAISRLQNQMAAAPPYLQDEMRSQIAQLQNGISMIQDSIRLQARIRTKAETPTPEQPREPDTFAKNFARNYGMSPEAAEQTGIRYLQNSESEEFANLTKEEKGRLAWVGMGATGGESKPALPGPFVPSSDYGLSGTTGSPLWKSWFARYYPSIISQFKGKDVEKQTEEGWGTFLAKERARLGEQFGAQSAYSRGERPSAYQPNIKTVMY